MLDGNFDSWSLRQLARRQFFWARLDDSFDFDTKLMNVDVQVFEQAGVHARAFFDQSQQNVFGADVIVIEAPGLLLSQLHPLASPVGKAFVHGDQSSRMIS